MPTALRSRLVHSYTQTSSPSSASWNKKSVGSGTNLGQLIPLSVPLGGRSILRRQEAPPTRPHRRWLTVPKMGRRYQLLNLAFPPPAPIRSALDEQTEEAIPPAPAGELPVEAGPELTWAALIGRALTSAERLQIREIIRRYAEPSKGTAAYWLVRAMNTVALDDKPLTLNYVGVSSSDSNGRGAGIAKS